MRILVIWKFGYESVCVVTCRMWVLRLVGWLNSCIRNLFEKLDRLWMVEVTKLETHELDLNTLNLW